MPKSRADREVQIRETCRLLEAVWQKYPDLRLCQLIVNATNKNDPYYVSDPELLSKIVQYDSDILSKK
jgi:hypothetical protein